MSKPPAPIKILTSVELGSPAADCAHFGICAVEVLSAEQWAVFQPRHIRQVKAELSRSGDKLLRFVFPLEGMRADTLASFFPAEGFRVDSACTFPLDVTDALGLPLGVRVRPGVYDLNQVSGGVIVELGFEVVRQGLTEANVKLPHPLWRPKPRIQNFDSLT